MRFGDALETDDGIVATTRVRAGRSQACKAPSGCRRARVRRQGPHNADVDDDIHGHNTLSAETTEVTVFYPFHPLRGSTLQIQRRPKRADGAVSVVDSGGKRLKIPMWMLSPDSAEIRISDQVVLSKEALLSLSSLLRIQTQRDHDNLRPIAVGENRGGHRGATRIARPDDPGGPGDACKRDGSGRPGRSDGALSSSGISKRRRKV